MTVTAALLVDGVRQREDGAIDLVGLVEGFHFPALPATIEKLPLFLRLAFDETERGQSKKLAIGLLAPDGVERSTENVLQLKIPERTDHPAPDGTLLPELSLTFHQDGVHTLQIRLDDVPIHALPVLVYPKNG